jgi:DNA-binding MarR family transcriptional regulator
MAGRRHVVRRLALEVRALTAAADMFNRDMARRTGVNTTDMRALELLGRRQGMTAGELAIELHLTTGAVTGVIDRLERAGHVSRAADSEDRRRVVVLPSESAKQTASTLVDDLRRDLHEMAAQYSDEQLELVISCLQGCRVLIEAHAGRLASAGPSSAPA